MRNIFYPLLGVVILLCLGAGAAGAVPGPADNVSGLWYTENHEGGVQLYKCDDKICGRFYWFSGGKTDRPRDDENPDPAKRDRALCRLQFMGGFTPDGQGHYYDGWIYSPRHGQIFNAEMTLIDANTLRLRGYMFAPALGESQTWTRAAKLPVCVSGS